MSLEHKKIFVTGGAGFLGPHVVRFLLEAGNEVVMLDDFSNGEKAHLGLLKDAGLLSILQY